MNSVSIGLVSCCGPKLVNEAPARALYISPLFKKSLLLAELRHAFVYVVSVEHGLVHPDALVEPYDKTMADVAKEWRAIWGNRVWSSLCGRHAKDGIMQVHFYAGKEYVSPIRAAGHGSFLRGYAEWFEPMRKMQFGQRLSWLNKHIAETA